MWTFTTVKQGYIIFFPKRLLQPRLTVSAISYIMYVDSRTRDDRYSHQLVSQPQITKNRILTSLHDLCAVSQNYSLASSMVSRMMLNLRDPKWTNSRTEAVPTLRSGLRFAQDFETIQSAQILPPWLMIKSHCNIVTYAYKCCMYTVRIPTLSQDVISQSIFYARLWPLSFSLLYCMHEFPSLSGPSPSLLCVIIHAEVVIEPQNYL